MHWHGGSTASIAIALRLYRANEASLSVTTYSENAVEVIKIIVLFGISDYFHFYKDMQILDLTKANKTQ